MGAEQFAVTAKGASAQEAFRAAVNEAQYDYGHAGYTGTMAEKDSFRMLDVPTGVLPEQFVRWVQDWDWNQDEVPGEYHSAVTVAAEAVDDKWGDAGCVKDTEPDTWWFFGWASS